MTLENISFAFALVIAARVIALPSWFLRQFSSRARLGIVLAQSSVLFALPWAFPDKPVILKAVVTLECCGALPPKLLDMYLHPKQWVNKGFTSWLGYMINPFILAPRLHAAGRVDRRAGRLLAVRGIIEMLLGGAVLWAAFSWWSSHGSTLASFWLEHAIKLFGAYLLVFDGAFVLATGLLRMLGMQVLDLSRDPIMATSPADFWRRYNCEAGRFLREDVFYPLGGRRHPIQGTMLTFLINGALHEYLALLMVGWVTCFQVMFFALQGVAVAATLRMRPRGWQRIAGGAATILFMYFSSIFFFATLDLLIPWYASDPW